MSTNQILMPQILMITQDQIDAIVDNITSRVESLVVNAKQNALPDIVTCNQSQSDMLTRSEVAKLLSLDYSTLWRYAKENRLVPVKVGKRRILYRVEDVKNFINSQKSYDRG